MNGVIKSEASNTGQ